MMGKTAFRKIADSHVLQVLSDGRMVLKLDHDYGHEITFPNAILDSKERGCDVVFNPNNIKTMIDHVIPAKDTASAIQGKIIREWSKEHNVEFLDVGMGGVCHAVIPEKGWILPGETAIMGDSHTCTHGAFCALTAGVGTTELQAGVITGLWVCPPQKVIRVNFIGKLPANVFAKDLILTLIKKIGVKGATNAVLEFGGEVIDAMSMAERMTISNMSVEAGATSGMMMVDRETIDYLMPLLKKYAGWHADEEPCDLEGLTYWNSDSDVQYDQVIDIDVSEMTPVITNNYSPGNVVKVSELAGKSVNQVYIGSCTNGRIEDLRIAANIFLQIKEKVADGIRCVVVPATQHIYEQAIKEGLIEIFLEAGCYVNGPTCGACLGMSCGVLAPGEVCVSTTNRNFEGRMGKGGMVHLASPATATVTAIKGKISEPTLGLCMEVVAWNKSVLNISGKLISLKSQVVPTGWQDVDFEKPDYSKYVGITCEPKHKDFSGKVFYLDIPNINTDHIIPAKYLNEVDKKVFGQHCLEDAPISAEHRQKLFGSQVIVAGENFGCGSSREHAPWAFDGIGVKCIIAPSFARIFENNMFAIGLLCITLKKEEIEFLLKEAPEELLIDWKKRSIHWGLGQGILFQLSDYQKELIRKGGLVGVLLEYAAELQKEGKLK